MHENTQEVTVKDSIFVTTVKLGHACLEGMRQPGKQWLTLQNSSTSEKSVSTFDGLFSCVDYAGCGRVSEIDG
jgi:hypothetical protein